jgi:chromosome segregation ATPase
VYAYIPFVFSQYEKRSSILLCTQSYEKEEESYRAELQATGDVPSTASNGLAAEAQRSTPISTDEVDKQIAAAEDQFRAVAAESSSLLLKLDAVASNATRFDALSAEIGRVIPEAETVVARAGNKKPGSKDAVDADDDEAAVQRRLEEIGAAAARVAGLGKTVGELQKTGDALIRTLGDLGFDESPRADEIAAQVTSARSRYGALQAAVADRQRVADASFARLHDPGHNLEVLLEWIAEAEDRIGQSESAVSVDPEALAEQVRKHQALSAELENRRSRVHAVAEACREADEQRAEELLDRFAAVQSRTDAHGQVLEGVVTRMTDLQTGVRQVDIVSPSHVFFWCSFRVIFWGKRSILEER